jgi:effector-binding domain-containing protein
VIPKVSGATVSVKSSNNVNYLFVEVPNTGEYRCTTFKPLLGETYTLTVAYKGETYSAAETMQSVSRIENVTQKNNGGFSGKDFQIEVTFRDPVAKNFYMSRFFANISKVPSYSILKDEYTNGNVKNWLFSDPDLKVGSTIDIIHYGVSEEYYNYMNKIISISSSSGGGSPFQTPPATVRGNIINQKNINNYALGYFSVSEIDVRNVTIQ